MLVKISPRHVTPRSLSLSLFLLLAAGAASASTSSATLATPATGVTVVLTEAELAPPRSAAITPHAAHYASAAPALHVPKATASDDTAPAGTTLNLTTLLLVGLGLLALSTSQRQQQKFSP